MEIVFLTPEEEVEIAKAFRKRVKIEKQLDNSLKEFCFERYSRYIQRFKEEIKKVKVNSSKLKKLKNFLISLDKIFVSTNIYGGPNVPGGSVFRDGIILKYNLFYRDFKFALIHEATHFLFHLEKKIDRKTMEIEANTSSFILMQIPPTLWKYSKLPSSFLLYKNDVESLRKLRFKARVIAPEEYLWLRHGALLWNRNVYKRKMEAAKKLIKKIKINDENEYSLPFVFWPGKKTVVMECVYLPKRFIGRDLRNIEKEFYAR